MVTNVPPQPPDLFISCLDMTGISPTHTAEVELPRAVWKELQALGHEVCLWQEAALLLHGRMLKGRTAAALADFLRRWTPTAPPAPPAESFRLLLGHGESGLTLVDSGVAFLKDLRWSALLRLPALRDMWAADIRGSHLRHLWQVAPQAWLLDPTPVPPGAVISGLDIPSWEALPGLGRTFHLQSDAGSPPAPATWEEILAALPAGQSVLAAPCPAARQWMMARYERVQGRVELAELYTYSDEDGRVRYGAP